jgi:hypothetical protein
VVADDGDEDVWAMNCRVSGTGASGRPVFGGGAAHGPIVLGIQPAGIAADAGRSVTDFATIGPVNERQAAAVRTLWGTCDAYVWHGQVPT